MSYDVEKMLQSAKFVDRFENQYMFQSFSSQESMTKLYALSFQKVCNVIFDDVWSTQLALLAAIGGPRRSTSWYLYEATDLNGSSDRQRGVWSRNCQRQRCVRRNLLHIVPFF